MSILERYVARALIGGVLVSLVVLVLLISLAALVGELDDVGEGQYGILDAVEGIGLTMPARAFDLFAVSALIGGIIGLGALATGNELLVMRAAGVSPTRVVVAVLKASVPLLVLMALLAEFVAPPLSQEAARAKRVATRGAEAAMTEEAVWLKDRDTIVRVGAVLGGRTPQDVQVFRFDAGGILVEVLRAESASVLPGGRWLLLDVQRDVLAGGELRSRSIMLPVYEIPSPLSAETLGLLISPPDLLSVSRLWREVRSDEPLATRDELRRSLWKKLSAPFLTLAMMLLAVPFALGGSSLQSVGRRLGFGAVVGVLAHIGVEAVAYLGALAKLDAAVVALAPVILTAGVAITLVSRIR
ncbi:MAG: LPS export ABC transporter permease LptG [Planctomycetes bacterium]|nr:LPS export ABC transporter permease LptG [Planctomycetota bacterium]